MTRVSVVEELIGAVRNVDDSVVVVELCTAGEGCSSTVVQAGRNAASARTGINRNSLIV